MISERVRRATSGWLVLWTTLAAMLADIGLFVTAARNDEPWLLIPAVLVLAGGVFTLAGLFLVNPNEARVLQLAGDYKGTVREPGLRWANPLYTKRAISTRVRNFESGRLKVNDLDGNPIEIAAVVVWKVVDTAEAVFEVDSYEDFLKVQSEAAVRAMASGYPYDAHEEGQRSLRGSTAEVAATLKSEIQERLTRAGVHVMEARISHLAYAPEIAAAMLRRQQAGAVIAARQKIVEGAVSMVDMALARLAESTHVQLDEERKAAMVSNLLVVLCAEREAQPVVNAGTLYQ